MSHTRFKKANVAIYKDHRLRLTEIDDRRKRLAGRKKKRVFKNKRKGLTRALGDWGGVNSDYNARGNKDGHQSNLQQESTQSVAGRPTWKATGSRWKKNDSLRQAELIREMDGRQEPIGGRSVKANCEDEEITREKSRRGMGTENRKQSLHKIEGKQGKTKSAKHH